MSFFKQLLLAISLFLTLAYAGNLLLSLESSRKQQMTQLRAHAQHAATALGLSLSDHLHDPRTGERLVGSLFDGGHFERIRVLDAEGERLLLERAAPEVRAPAPAWFARLVNLPAVRAEALVGRDGQPTARVQVDGSPRLALATLWHMALGSLIWLTLCAGAAALLGGVWLRRQLRPLQALTQQAQALERHEFISQPRLPANPQLRPLVGAMNRLVERLRERFEAHARQVEALRREVYVDALTGLANRRSLEMHLRSWREGEEAVGRGFLAVLRLRDLGELNQRLGGEAVDRLICHLASMLRSRCADLPRSAVLARVRGSEFALLLPGLLGEEVEALAERTFELAEFLLHVCQVELKDQGEPIQVALHTSCSARREMNTHLHGRALLGQLGNVERVEHDHESECCGFGGTFSVRMPDIAGAMVADKTRALKESGAARVVSADCGCLLNINGALEKQHETLRGQHLATFLWQRTGGRP